MAPLIDEESLDWSLQHCKKYSFNFFPIPFEYEAIENNWDDIKRFILSQNLSKWKVRPSRRFIVPKQEFGFRAVTELDPLDHLVYSALIYEIGNDIESSRISKENNVVFSYRYSPDSDGRIFDPDYNYLKFRETCREMAESGSYGYVAVTDISDFFLHIYEHRLENALNEATDRTYHVEGILHLLKHWNAKVSTGIPIGPIVSRLLAEATIADIDNLLDLEGIRYCRWNDDFRMFVNSYAEGYKALSMLAEFLNENHNMTLQESKTEIVPTEVFLDKYIFPERRLELVEIDERLSGIIEETGLCDLYDLFYGGGSEETFTKIESLNLENVLMDQIQSNNPNYMLIRYILNRFGIMRDGDHIEVLLDSVDKLYPVFIEVLGYIQRVDIQSQRKQIIGGRLVQIYNDPLISSIKYTRMWIMSCFSLDPEMANTSELVQMYDGADEVIKREIITTLGKKGEDGWIRRWKRSWDSFSPGVRRAFLASAGCLPKDERNHFFNSIRNRLDPLEKAIIDWKK